MTDLERLELVLRRVHGELDKTPRFVVSDEIYMLMRIIEELAKENIRVNKADDRSNPSMG